MSMIEVTNLRKSFGALEVLRDVSFRVEKGDVVAVIGSSGSGKSTLLRCLIGLEEVTGGSIRIDGQDLCRDGVYASAAARKAIILRMGMVFQHFNLYPHLSVVKNLEIAPRLVKGRKGPDLRAQAMELLGFTVTDNAAQADLIIGAAALDDQALAAVQAGTPYIATGSDPLGYITENLVTDLAYTTLGMEALHTVSYPADSLITASYAADEDYVMYTYSCGVLTSVPADATVLIQAIDEDSFIAGCCLNEDGTPIDGFVEAIALERNGMDLTIFANSVNNRAHQQDDYRYVTNAIYAKMLSDQPLDLDAVSVSFVDVPDSHWAADGIAYAVDNGLMTGTSSTAFSPAASTTRGMLMTVLARQAGVDTSTGSTWYEAGMNWAVDEGISDGSNPNGSITRQELAVMLYRSAGAQPGTADLSGYADGDSVASWAADAVRWAVDEGILSGKSGNRLDPAGTASRAEVAVMLQRAFA